MIKSIHKPGRQRQWEQQLFANGKIPLDQIWLNILNPNSLRLTLAAHRLLLQNQIKFYKFQLDSITNLQLLQLDRLLASPYFVRDRKHIELMGEQDAIMLELHASNLKQYLDNLGDE